MNTLKDTQLYLAGPMEFVEDHGVAWREKCEELLTAAGVQIKNIFSPTNKPKVAYAQPVTEEWALQQKYRDTQDWIALERQMKRIITMDLRMVDKSDIIIAWLPKDVRTVGTIEEIVTARRQKKPVIVICEAGIAYVSAWIIGLVGAKRIFSSLEDAVSYISDVATNGPRDERDAKEFVLFNMDERDND